MIPVETLLEANAFYGATGFSALRKQLFTDAIERVTVLYLRDAAGSLHNVLILPSETLERTM